MKICPRCGKAGEFHKDKKHRDGLQSFCKRCNSKQAKLYYRQNKERYKAHAARARQESKQGVLDYLAEHPCVDCGESDPVVLDFDHVRGKKTYNIAWMVSSRYPLATILKEIEKCEVRCANCHRRRTAKVMGSFRLSAKRTVAGG
jgi:L-lysine 2,3-aminomutase